MTSLLTRPMIPCESGMLTLTEALTQGQDHGSLDSGDTTTDTAFLMMLSLMRDRARELGVTDNAYLQHFAGGFDLQGETPFLQVPEVHTRDLPWVNPSELLPKYASGTEATLLSHHLHNTLIRLKDAEALAMLVTYQFFSTARGRTKRNPSSNTPAANQVIFTLHGQTLEDDITLNTLGKSGITPAHEVAPDWSQWARHDKGVSRSSMGRDATTTRLWPWKTVTLNFKDGTCNAVRQASGLKYKSETKEDLITPLDHPYAANQISQKVSRKVTTTEYLRVGNPDTREVCTAL